MALEGGREKQEEAGRENGALNFRDEKDERSQSSDGKRDAAAVFASVMDSP